jgi:hypothetical protein
LIYFQGCPNAALARENLAAALESHGRKAVWEEWDLGAQGTPSAYRRFGSPTILVDGEDVTGVEGRNAAMACRADPVPSVGLIASRLA